MGFERNYKKQVTGIWKESVKKDFWSYKRKRRNIENRNKRIWWIQNTKAYNKSHKSIKIKLVWPFTTNGGRQNGKKRYKLKPMLARPLGRPKYRWEDDMRNDMKKLKIRIGLAASRIAISGNYMLRGAKRLQIEVVVPEEEEDSINYKWEVNVAGVFQCYSCIRLLENPFHGNLSLPQPQTSNESIQMQNLNCINIHKLQ